MTSPLRDHEEAHNTLVEFALSAMHGFDENTL